MYDTRILAKSDPRQVAARLRMSSSLFPGFLLPALAPYFPIPCCCPLLLPLLLLSSLAPLSLTGLPCWGGEHGAQGNPRAGPGFPQAIDQDFI